MEDQRNWSDASFKTYSRPLAIPFPYAIAAGERVRQTVRIDVRDVAPPRACRPTTIVVRLEVGGPVFELGLGAATAPDPAPARAECRHRAAVLVELDLRTPNWRAALAARSDVGSAARRARDRHVRRPVRRARGRAGAAWRRRPASRASACSRQTCTSRMPPLLTALRSALAAAGVHAPVVGGSRAHFTELNREWEVIPRDVDGVAFSTTPLFHSLGTEQLVESVAVQRTIARQAVRLADGLPVHIGPVTLRPRFNDVATTPPPTPTREDLVGGLRSAVHRRRRSASAGTRAGGVDHRERRRPRRARCGEHRVLRGVGRPRHPLVVG